MQEIEDNNRMGKTRDLFKKIRDTKGICHVKMGTIKEGNGMDLTEAENIKKWWQEYTEELYKNYIHDTDNHDDVITHLKIFIYLKVIVIYYKTLCMFVLYFSNLL